MGLTSGHGAPFRANRSNTPQLPTRGQGQQPTTLINCSFYRFKNGFCPVLRSTCLEEHWPTHHPIQTLKVMGEYTTPFWEEFYFTY